MLTEMKSKMLPQLPIGHAESTFQSSLEIYGHNNDPELSRGLIHLLCVNLSEEISIRNNWYLFS